MTRAAELMDISSAVIDMGTGGDGTLQPAG